MRQFRMNNHQSRLKRSMSAADITGDLPIYNPESTGGRRDTHSWSSTSEMKYKLIHLMPVVVMLCFFILWCFSSPVDLETKDGRTTFVPRTKNKKSPQTSEAADLDLTVLALESPPDGFLSVSDSHDHSASSIESHVQNPSFSVSHVQNASLSVSHELEAPFSISQEPSAPISDFHEPNELSIDLHEPNASLPDDAKLLFPVSDEPGLSYAGESNKASQQASGEG